MLTARQITSKYWVTRQSLNDWRKKWIIDFKKVNSRFFLYDESFFQLNKDKDSWIELSEFCKVYDLIKSWSLIYELVDQNLISKMSEEQKEILQNL